MASDVRPPRQTAQKSATAGARASPAQLQTNNLTRNPRYSYLETPVEMQGATFHQFSSPTNSVIDESPISPRDGYTHPDPETIASAPLPVNKAPERTGSPYGFPAPQQVHPAYFAPYSEDTNTRQQPLPAVEPPPSAKPDFLVREDVKPKKSPSTQGSDERKVYEQPQRQPTPSSHTTQIYAPDSLGGPTGHDNHRPGQVAHPNSAVNPHWKHGLCEPDATCCLSLVCPCMVYGETRTYIREPFVISRPSSKSQIKFSRAMQSTERPKCPVAFQLNSRDNKANSDISIEYRLSRKAQKQDSTDLLGYESCNGSCGFMSIACGFQCRFRSLLCLVD